MYETFSGQLAELIGYIGVLTISGENATQALKHKPKPNPKKSKTDGTTQKTTPQATTRIKVNSTTKPSTKKPKIQRIL